MWCRVPWFDTFDRTTLEHSTMPHRNNPLTYPTLTLITFIAHLAGTFITGGRFWGVSIFAWTPTPFALTLLPAGILLLIALYLRLHNAQIHSPDPSLPGDSTRRFLWSAAALTILFAAAFWFARTRTHFLGDGYQLLSHLGDNNPVFLKISEPGEARLHWTLKQLLGNGSHAALLSYRLLSIAAGLISLIAAALTAPRLFADNMRRLLFWLGIATGGYALLFFGYVEHYSLLAAAVIVFTLLGIRVARGDLPCWVILIPLLAAITLHLVALTLIPAALYLLLRGSRMAALSSPMKLSLLAVIVIAGLGLFFRLYGTVYYFRYAFVPIVPIEITAEGYTLFSLAHLLDMLNLLLLLLPGLLLLIAALVDTPKRAIRRFADYRFLALACGSSLLTVFILDPKLGMPRDWDLFSFAGVPLVIGFYYLVLDSRSRIRSNVLIASLGVLLAAIALTGRVASQLDETHSVPQMRSYMALDTAKNRAAFHTLRSYYEQLGDPATAAAIEEEWRRTHPEGVLAVQAEQLLNERRYDDAIALSTRSIRINPMNWNSFSCLGTAYLQKQQYDTALTLLRIADGLNPGNPIILHNLGYGYVWKGETEKAERLWLKALELDSTMTQSLVYLARLYEQTRQPDKLFATLERLARHPNPPSQWLVMLADLYLSRKRYDQAAIVLVQAGNLGFDSTQINQRIAAHPQLQAFMSRTE